MKKSGTAEEKVRASKAKRIKRVTKEELENARKFLRSDPRGQRLLAAEHSLVLLIKGDLPRIRQYLFNAAYDLREIQDIENFQRTTVVNSNVKDLVNQTNSGGFVKVSLEKEQLHFMLFYQKKLEKNEAILFSRSFGEVLAVTFAALGLDMTGLASIDPERFKKVEL